MTKILCHRDRLSIIAPAAIITAGLTFAAHPASAQAVLDETDPQAEPILGEILVTAQKRGVAESAQRVPIAITAFDSDALEDRVVQDLQSLTTAAPNVTLDDIGTVPGIANFAIRGFGVNSSLPSVEPAVGTFIDGIYLGVPYGAVIDLFDVESIEILRGPQGLLFGRNTTGGAVTIRSRRPGRDFAVRGRVALETGPEYTADIAVDLPATDTLRFKLAGHYGRDEGWFENQGSSFPLMETASLRAIGVWQPTSTLDATLIYERTRINGEGSVVQNPSAQSGFDIDIDEPGFTDIEVDSLTLESNLDVAFGDGVITTIVGLRAVDHNASLDSDGLPTPGFRAGVALDQEQLSGELRYAGSFGALDVTAGAYYFEQDYIYREERNLFDGDINSRFGGDVDQSSWALFGQLRYHLTDNFSLVGGARYSSDQKTVQIATFSPVSPCSFETDECVFNFPGPAFPDSPGSRRWQNLTPKLGFDWEAMDRMLVYGSWSRGVRNGSFNIRVTSDAFAPGPFDEEIQDAFELGVKSEFFNRKLRVNIAGFYNLIQDIQRDVIKPDPDAGLVVVTDNTADATIRGAELEIQAIPLPGLILSGHVGYTDGFYRRVRFDLNGDGTVDAIDRGLEIPRLAPWSYGAQIAYTFDIANDQELAARIGFSHRDSVAFTDANSTRLKAVNDLTANLSYAILDEAITFSLYGRNLLDKVFDSNFVPLPPSVGGGAFRTLNEGRVIGLGARLRF